MKYNDKEIALLSEEKCDLEGRLNYSRPYSNIYNQTGCKERWFKLKANLLFYFRINDTGKIDSKQPFGVLVLENCKIQTEVQAFTPFAFSIVFDDDWERRHILSGRSEDHVSEWINALNVASYEYWRSQLLILQKRISLHTGKDPLIMIPRNDGCRRTLQWSPQPSEINSFETTFSITSEDNVSNNNWAKFEDNQESLIEFSPQKNGNTKTTNITQKQKNQDDWDFFESLNFGTEQRKTVKTTQSVRRSREVTVKINFEESETVEKSRVGEVRFNPFDAVNKDSAPQMNLLKPIPHPPTRSRSPKNLRTQLLTHAVHRTHSDSRLNQHSMPMPPLRKKTNKHKVSKGGSTFYLSDDEDSDSGVTINPIYQSTSDIVHDFGKKDDAKKTSSEVNLIDL